MTNQEILDNAPKGATHVIPNFKVNRSDSEESRLIYLMSDGFKWYAISVSNDWVIIQLGSWPTIRSLSDIREIVELRERVNVLEESLKTVATMCDQPLTGYDQIQIACEQILKAGDENE